MTNDTDKAFEFRLSKVPSEAWLLPCAMAQGDGKSVGSRLYDPRWRERRGPPLRQNLPSMDALSSGWFGEGETKFYLDGDGKFPTIAGTGTEAYFGADYGFPARYSTV